MYSFLVLIFSKILALEEKVRKLKTDFKRAQDKNRYSDGEVSLVEQIWLLFFHSFVRLVGRSLTHSLNHSLTYSFIRSFFHSIHPSICPTNPTIHSNIHPFSYSRLFFRSFVRSFVLVVWLLFVFFVCSLIPSFHSYFLLTISTLLLF